MKGMTVVALPVRVTFILPNFLVGGLSPGGRRPGDAASEDQTSPDRRRCREFPSIALRVALSSEATQGHLDFNRLTRMGNELVAEVMRLFELNEEFRTKGYLSLPAGCRRQDSRADGSSETAAQRGGTAPQPMPVSSVRP